MAYRPQLRATLAFSDHVLKVYARQHEFEAAAAGLQAVSSVQAVPTAPLEASLPDLRLTVQRRLTGEVPPRAEEVSGDAGELLAALHRSSAPGVRLVPPAAQLAEVSATVDVVSVLCPHLERRLEALVDRLREAEPAVDELVLSHGDFHAAQLLRGREGLAMIDVDELCLAPRALDVTRYAAQLVRGDATDLDRALGLLEGVLDGYGRRPAALQWYLATGILRRARAPFRYLVERWPARVEAMVDAAEQALIS